MPPTPRALPFTDTLLLLSHEIRDQQTRLDRDYEARLDAFLLLLKAAQDAGQESLVRGLAPSELVLGDAEIALKFRFAHSSSEQSSLNIQPLDLGFMRRYAYSKFAQNTLEFSVRRIPHSPGAPPQEGELPA
ncbi:MAG: hypothetical protein ACJ741_04170 [Pyrinomonadaceae bacterium]